MQLTATRAESRSSIASIIEDKSAEESALRASMVASKAQQEQKIEQLLQHEQELVAEQKQKEQQLVAEHKQRELQLVTKLKHKDTEVQQLHILRECSSLVWHVVQVAAIRKEKDAQEAARKRWQMASQGAQAAETRADQLSEQLASKQEALTDITKKKTEHCTCDCSQIQQLLMYVCIHTGNNCSREIHTPEGQLSSGRPNPPESAASTAQQ